MTALVSYLGDPDLKAAFLAEITKHEQQDQFIKGTYGRMNGSFKGCAIGCSLHSLNVLHGKTGKASAQHTGQHARYEAELGLPTWLAHLEDRLFEGLPDDLSVTWPRRFAEAIPVGAVVTDALLARILLWVLTDADFGVNSATDRDAVKRWIDAIAGYIEADSRGAATADQRKAAAIVSSTASNAWAASTDTDAIAVSTARDAIAAWEARAARASWDVWDASAAQKADAFYPAFSEFVLAQLRALVSPESITT